MQITQVFFTDNDSPVPQSIINCIDSVKMQFPNMPHVIYNIESARSFIKDNLDATVLNAFDMLRPYAYKADLFRYCALYILGGWYFDSTVRLNTGVIIPENINCVSFRDYPATTNSCWSVFNGVLFARPGNKVYNFAINEVVNNCNTKYYGTCNLSPTGPVLLGRAFATFGDDPHNLFFNTIHLTPGYTVKNPALVLSDGVIFAYLKQRGASGLSDYGAIGTNNYVDFYNNKTVYA